MVNDATVTSADIIASNGIVHIIDKVLLPPADTMEGEPTNLPDIVEPLCPFCPDGLTVDPEFLLPSNDGSTCTTAVSFAATMAASNPLCDTVQLAEGVCCPPSQPSTTEATTTTTTTAKTEEQSSPAPTPSPSVEEVIVPPIPETTTTTAATMPGTT